MASKVLILLGAVFVVAKGDAPYPAKTLISAPYPAKTLAPYAPAIPAPVYGPPELIESPPEQIITSYNYKLETPKPILKTGPYPAPELPAPVYGPPKIVEEVIVPAPVYGPPKIVERPVEHVYTSYDYKLETPKPILKTGPYPAPELPVPVYGPPKIVERPVEHVYTSYNYKLETPKPVLKTGPYPAPELPAPVYGPPKIVEEIVVPAPVYGPPKIVERPVEHVYTSYNYRLETPKPVLKTGPYPAPELPVPVYGPPKIVEQVPAVPAPVYGLPEIVEKVAPIRTEYKYDLPHEVPVLRTYPAPAKIDLPVHPAPVYGVPKIEVPVEKPILTRYDYKLPEIVKPAVKLGPYAPAILKEVPVPAVPHLEYGLPY